MTKGSALRTAFVGLALIAGAVALSVRPIQPVDEGHDLVGQARRYLDDGRYPEAVRTARQALAATERDHGVESVATAETLDLLVSALYNNRPGVPPDLLPLAERAVMLRGRLAGEDSPELAPALLNLGLAAMLTGDHTRGRDAILRALAVRDLPTVTRDRVLIEVLVGLGQAMLRASRYEEAGRYAERAMRLAESWFGPDDLLLARSLRLRASLALLGSDPDGARLLGSRSLDIYRRALRADHPEIGTALSVLAIALFDSGDYAAARPIYEEVLKLHTAAFGRDGAGSAHYNFALFLTGIGDLAGAKVHMDQAFDSIIRVVGPDHPDAAGTGGGWLLNEMGDYEGARRVLQHALEVNEQHFGPVHDRVAHAAASLGVSLVGLGRYEEARTQLTRAVEIFQETRGPSSHLLATALQNLGLVEERLGHLDAALELLRRAHAILVTILDTGHPETAAALGHLARIRWRLGASRQAFDDSLEAIKTLHTSVVRAAQALPERTALGYATALNDLLDLPSTLLARSSGTVAGTGAHGLPAGSEVRFWDIVVRTRGTILDEMALRHRQVLDTDSPEVPELVAELGRARNRLARFISSDNASLQPGEYQARMLELVDTKEHAEAVLADRSAPFRDAIAARNVGWTDVRAALPPNTALVSFVRFADLANDGRESYLALVQAPYAARIFVIPLGSAAPLDVMVEHWRSTVSHPPTGPADAARYAATAGALRAAVWDPVAQQLSGADQVLVVPDGALSLVSFATLPLPDGRYLVEAGPRIHYLAAERDVVRTFAAERKGRGLLLVGDPEFDSGESLAALPRAADATSPGSDHTTFRGIRSACGQFGTLRFDRLPESGAETAEIEALWRTRAGGAFGGMEPVIRLVGAEASEAAFKEAAPGMRILHLATHGFSVQDRCDTPLTRPDPWTGRSAPMSRIVNTLESPLLLSGLAFAGANRRDERDGREQEEDGILTAEEIASLDLRGVEWAFLSACGTGIGPVQSGEGVIGLRRTFQVAGARTVIMSLWDVDDQQTRDWSRRLYENRFQGHSTVDSARLAMNAILTERRRAGVSDHPAFWGAFIVAGDWR